MGNLLALWLVASLIPLPFIDQESPEWWAPFDCGPASATMVIEYYTTNRPHPLDFYNKTGTDLLRLQSLWEIGQWMETWGVPTTYIAGMTMEHLERSVNLRHTPVIVLVEGDRYGHIVVVVGIERDTVIVHDPLVGPFRAIPRGEFETLWRYDRYWLDNVALVPDDVPPDFVFEIPRAVEWKPE